MTTIPEIKQHLEYLGRIQDAATEETIYLLDTNVVSPAGLYGLGTDIKLTDDKIREKEKTQAIIRATNEALMLIASTPEFYITPEVMSELERKIDTLELMERKEIQRTRHNKRKANRREYHAQIENDARQMAAITTQQILTNNRILREYTRKIKDPTINPYAVGLLSRIATITKIRGQGHEDETRTHPETLVTKTFALAKQQPTTLITTSGYANRLFELAIFLYLHPDSPIFQGTQSTAECYKLAKHLRRTKAISPNIIFYNTIKNTTPTELTRLAREEYARITRASGSAW